jgi:hypothetical protein
MPPQPEEERHRRAGQPRAPPRDPNIFADSDKSRERRPRRNSDTSVQEKTSKLLDPNDDRRRRPRESRKDGKPRGPSRRLDVIDKLDVTSIYGTGRKFIYGMCLIKGC